MLDFGLVKNVSENRDEELTQAGLRMGSPKYMAPEQISGGAVDARTDIYALGVIMYEMVAGKVPFDSANNMSVLMSHMNDEAPPIRKVNPAAKISSSMEEMIARAMAKSPNDRFRSMDEVLAALKRLGPNAPPPEPSASLTADADRLPTSTGSGPQVSRVVKAAGAAAVLPAISSGPGPSTTAATAITGALQSPGVPASKPSSAVILAGVVGVLALVGSIGYLTLRKADVTTTPPTQIAAPASSVGSVGSAGSVGAAGTAGTGTAPTAPASASAAVTEIDFSALAPASASAAPKSPATTAPAPAPAKPKAGAPAPPPAAAARPPAPPAGAAGAAGAAGSKANCNPPFSYDADGNKHFKPECYAQ